MSLLFVESEVVERLRVHAPKGVYVGSADQDDDDRMHQRSPALWVTYMDAAVPDQEAYDVMRITQLWGVVAVVRSVGDLSGERARAKVGELAQAAISILAGWVPPGAARPMLLYRIPKTAAESGMLLAPIIFSTEIEIAIDPPA